MATRNVAADRNAYTVVQRAIRVVPTPDGPPALAYVNGYQLFAATIAPISGDALNRAVAMYKRSPAVPRTRALGYVERGV